MAARLPDELVLEYDMQQLIDGDDSVFIDLMNGSASQADSFNVDELLTNCSVGVSIATPMSSTPSSSKSLEKATSIISDEFCKFLFDNEVAQRDLEKLVKEDSNNTKLENQTAHEQQMDDAIDHLDAFTNLDMMSSPCPSVPSSCPSTMAGSPEAGDVADASSTTKEKVVKEDVIKYQECAVETVKESEIGQEEDEEMEEETTDDEIDLLGKEAKYLDAQVDFLQSRAKSIRRRRQSIKQHHSCDAKQLKLLAKSQQDKQLLNNLVMQQKIYQDNFQAMLAFAPVNDVRMALMTPLESYIRLGKDFNERRKTILSLREEKLDMTYNFIEQKAAGLDLNQPHQYSDTFEKFGKRYCVNFAISKYDGVSVFQVGRALYELIAGKDEALNCAMGSTTIREYFDTIKCNFMHQRIVSSMKWEEDEEAAAKIPDMESNAIFYCRFSDNSAVLTTDYIDQDDLHPYDTSNLIRKDLASGVVLSGHTDADGNKFVVMKRYLMAKYHMYPHKVSQEQQDRFFASMPRCNDTMKTLITDHLQRNQADCSRVCEN